MAAPLHRNKRKPLAFLFRLTRLFLIDLAGYLIRNKFLAIDLARKRAKARRHLMLGAPLTPI
jgi:hypothetical protein